jgi:microcystin-dependent protein
MARREYQAGRPTTLTGSGLNSTALTFTIAEAFNWPDGSGGTLKFWVTVDPGTAQEERLLCTGLSGLTVTIDAAGRGVDGTGARSHAFGAVVWPSWSATDADEANEHINATTGIHGIAGGLAPLASPTFTGTVVLPSTTSIGNVSSTELSVLDGIPGTLTATELGYVDGVTSSIQTQLNTIVNTTIPASTPVGTIVMYGGTSAPTGWLLCNGQSTASYANLAAVVGANVPDLRGRAPIGYGTSTDTTNVPTARTTIGAVTGKETHTLITAEIPLHSHSGQITFGSGSGGTAAVVPSGNNPTSQPDTGSTGGNGAHNNMQPSTVVNFIIKT